MLIAKFRINARPGTEPDIKEVLAMACESMGTATVKEIENTDEGMRLTIHIDAPGGSALIFKKEINQFLRRYKDTQITYLQEVLPEQMSL